MQIGDQIIDSAGRRGVVTELIRDLSYEPLGVVVYGAVRGVFARPVDVPYRTRHDIPGLGAQVVLSATAWTMQSDGSLLGMWFDSSLGAQLRATVAKKEQCAGGANEMKSATLTVSESGDIQSWGDEGPKIGGDLIIEVVLAKCVESAEHLLQKDHPLYAVAKSHRYGVALAAGCPRAGGASCGATCARGGVGNRRMHE